MERKKGIRSHFLISAITVLSLAGCSFKDEPHEKEITFKFTCGSLATKVTLPDEEKISDISLMIFDENGDAEECIWLKDGVTEYPTDLIVGKKYILCACANFGYQIYADNIDELEEITFHLAYPDEYRQGIPMYARKEFSPEEGMDGLAVELERLMAKISLKIDRSKLSDGIEMYVRSVQIGNCPRKASVFKPNAAGNGDDCFPSGFLLRGYETDILNSNASDGASEAVSLYMLENMQGAADAEFKEDSDKVFGENDIRNDICSYIEIDMDYTSDKYNSLLRGLKYRFYLGEGRNDFNIERNCHYNITVKPEDDGLGDDGWRVDKTGLVYCGPTSLKAYPSDYIVGDIGEKIRIWCETIPGNVSFDVGEEYMKDDKANGIYDYVIDEDGRGATLTLTGPGRGLIYMEAGSPINDAALFIIEVNQP